MHWLGPLSRNDTRVCALLVAAALVGPPGSAAGTPADAPSVVVIVADDAGYNEIGYAGDNGFSTPRIDELAGGGVRFTAGYVASPACSPSRAALLTGTYPQRFGYERNISNDLNGTDGLSVGQVTLLERFHDLGYATGVIGKWHLGAVDGVNRPLDKGADEFFGVLFGGRSYWGGVADPEDVVRRGDDSVERVWINEGNPGDYDPVNGRYITDAFGDEAVAFIDAHHDDPHPFFLYLSFTAPHDPLQAKLQDLARFPELAGDTRTRAAMTLAMDRAVGKVLDALSAHGIDGDTIVVFVNDNGGPPSRDNSPFNGYKAESWEGGIRVPFVLRGPGFPVDLDYDRPVSTLDLTPTLLAAGGGTTPITDGIDLAPYLKGQLQGDPHDILYWRFVDKWAIREGDWKLTRPVAGGPVRLFNLAFDPGETDDVAGQQSTIVEDLLYELTLWETEIEKPRWGIAGADAVNRLDQFVYNRQATGGGNWGADGAWLLANTRRIVKLSREDAYANAVLEFPVSDTSYVAHNNLTRGTGQTFMLNEIRFTGDLSSDTEAVGSITGNPVLFTESRSNAGPRIRVDATSSGSGTFALDLQTTLLLADDLEISGSGTQSLILSGGIDEYVPGRSLVKAGSCGASLSAVTSISGDLRVDAGSLSVEASAGNIDTVTIGANPATLGISDPAILSAGTIEVLPDGVLEGDGTLRGMVTNSGTIRPGSPIGALALEGSLASSGVLKIEIAGVVPGDFDTIEITGHATVGGTLAASLSGVYVPQEGDTFEIVSASTIAGAFASAMLPALPAPLTWNVGRDADSITLMVGLFPDADPDGDGYSNRIDNCPTITNPGQKDHDGDGLGDACDPDDDDDGVLDASDNCPVTPNSSQADSDADGLGDACDWCHDADGDGYGSPGSTFCDGGPDDDCDDGLGQVRPGAPELCDGIDNDCDLELDEALCEEFDINSDDAVNGTEVAWMARAFGLCGALPVWWSPVDYTNDGCVDGDDLAILASVWNCDGLEPVCR